MVTISPWIIGDFLFSLSLSSSPEVWEPEELFLLWKTEVKMAFCTSVFSSFLVTIFLLCIQWRVETVLSHPLVANVFTETFLIVLSTSNQIKLILTIFCLLNDISRLQFFWQNNKIRSYTKQLYLFPESDGRTSWHVQILTFFSIRSKWLWWGCGPGKRNLISCSYNY